MASFLEQTDFLSELKSLPGGCEISHCIQCGTCTGSCPTAQWMDHSPRQIFALIRCGMRDEALKSNTPWTCASCYTCSVRCPKEIKITDIMYALKRLSVEEGKATRETKPARVMADTFVSFVNRNGRNSETDLMRNVYLKGSMFRKMFGDLPVGLRLLRLGRLPIFAKRISREGRLQIKNIVEAVEQMDG